jgi:hypothetical protein
LVAFLTDRSFAACKNADMLMRNRTYWTDEENTELLALKNSGVSIQRISVRLKRTQRAIAVRLYILGHGTAKRSDPAEVLRPERRLFHFAHGPDTGQERSREAPR